MEEVQRFRFDGYAGEGFAALYRAWTREEVERAVESIFRDEDSAGRLPADRDARIVVKPNLNNDLVALTGNSTDLRVLGAVVGALLRRGYRRVVVADGSNVGIDRRGIDSFKRLRVDRLCERLGVPLVNLNEDEGEPVPLRAGARPRVARTVLDKDFLVSLPRIKTHAEATFTCAMKNWMGIVVGQDKRQMHWDLPGNIFELNQRVKPDLVIVDGLVGMEGNGPGDGDPVRLGLLLHSRDALLNDLLACRLVALDWRRVGYLRLAREAGLFDDALAWAIEREVPVIRPIRPAPPRSPLAVLSERRELLWLKKAVRPLVEKPQVAELAYRLRIIQDVYDRRDDTLRLAGRRPERCPGGCTRCQEVCPAGLSRDEIGVKLDPDACLHCLYCWWVCPEDALLLEGEPNHLARQIARYKRAIEEL